MAITYFGTGTFHTDGGSLLADGTIRECTPPGSMVAGHLVIIDAVVRNATVTPAISADGGQTWTSETLHQGQSMSVRRFWCRFNGTWSANPSIDFVDTAGTNACGGLMTVYAPNAAGATWSQDAAQSAGQGALIDGVEPTPNAGGPYLACPGGTAATPTTLFTTSSDGALVHSFCVTADNNDNTVYTANNWSSATIGWDNSGGVGTCSSTLYQIVASAGAVAGYTLLENAASANDNGRYSSMSFLEIPPSGSSGRMLLLGVG